MVQRPHGFFARYIAVFGSNRGGLPRHEPLGRKDCNLIESRNAGRRSWPPAAEQIPEQGYFGKIIARDVHAATPEMNLLSVIRDQLVEHENRNYSPIESFRCNELRNASVTCFRCSTDALPPHPSSSLNRHIDKLHACSPDSGTREYLSKWKNYREASKQANKG